MRGAEILAQPDRGLRFIAAELVRAQGHMSANEAVDRAVAELRSRGAEPSFAGICAARVAAVEAHKLRLGPPIERQDSDATSRAATKPSNAPVGRLHPVTGTLDLRRRLASVDFDPNAEFRPPSWLIKGIFPHQGIGLVIGESAAGKTFLAIHAALCVAWGLPFFGRRTSAGGVLYVAAEGGSSVLPRFRAADGGLGGAIGAQRLAGADMRRHPLRIVTEAPNLSRDGDARPLVATVEDAAADFAAQGSRLALVVIDTWHAAMGGGDENSAADAGSALAPLRAAAEAHGALVLAIHHSGKDAERGARGSSALPAAADAIMVLTVPGHTGPAAKPSDAIRNGVATKVRDGEAGGQISYRLPVVPLGKDDDGDPWTTCVVEPVAAPKTDDDGLTKGDRDFMEAVSAAAAERADGRAPIAEVRARFYAARRETKPDANRKAFRRLLEGANAAGRVEVDAAEQWIWPK